MKILFLYAKGNSEITNRQSALGSYMNCLCEILSKKGYEIHFNHVSFLQIANQNSNQNSHVTNPIRRNKIPLPNFIKGIIKNFIRLKQIRKLKSEIVASKFQPDVIIEFYNYGSNLGLHFSKAYNCPLIEIYDAPVLEEHEYFNGRSYIYRWKISRREENTLLNAKKIVVYSNAVKKYLMEKIGKSGDSFQIHQNVDFTRFDFMESKPFASEMNIGFIGSFLAWHRDDLLLDAFEKIIAKGMKANLYRVDSGQKYEKKKDKIHLFKSKSRIFLTGFLDGNELKEIKSKLHIGVMPGSNWYGAPNKIFEYGAAGLAVIAPDTPTIKDLFVDGNELNLFKWDDSIDLQLNLETLLKEEGVYKQISSNLNQKIRNNYSENKTGDFYHQLIQSTLK